MPVKIPKATAIPRTQLAPAQGVVGIDTRDAGGGLRDLAQAADAIAAQRDQSSMAFADADFLTYKTEQDNAHADDEDYTTSTANYTEDMNAKLGELAATISKPRLRNAFVKSQQTRLASGIAAMNTKVLAREKDDMRARTSASLDALLKSGAAADGDVLSATDAGRRVIEAGVNANYFSEEEGYSLTKRHTETMAVNKLSAMDAASVLVALDQPWAKNLPPPVYKRIKDNATKEAVANWAQHSAEEFVASGLGPVEVNREIDKETDAFKQASLQSAYDAAYNRDKNAIKTIERDTYEKYYEIVLDGVSSGQPVDIFALRRQDPIEFSRMSPEDTNRLLGMASDASKGVAVKSTPYGLKSEMDTLVAHEHWDDAQALLDSRHRDMRREDRDSYSEEISGKSAGPAKGFMSIKDKVRLGFPPGTDNVVQKGLPIAKQVDEWFIQYQSDHGMKKPSDTEVQEKIDSLWVEHATNKWFGFPTGEVTRHAMTETDEIDALNVRRKDDPEVFQLAHKYIAVEGLEPNNFDYVISATDELTEMKARDPEIFAIVAKRDALVDEYETQYRMSRFTEEFDTLMADEMDRRIIHLREEKPDLYGDISSRLMERNRERSAQGLPLESVSPEQFMGMADQISRAAAGGGAPSAFAPAIKDQEKKRRFNLQNLRWEDRR